MARRDHSLLLQRERCSLAALWTAGRLLGGCSGFSRSRPISGSSSRATRRSFSQMSSDPALTVGVATAIIILAIGFVLLVLAAYTGFRFNRIQGSRIYRLRALWMGAASVSFMPMFLGIFLFDFDYFVKLPSSLYYLIASGDFGYAVSAV